MRSYGNLKGDISLVKDKIDRVQNIETENEQKMLQIILSLSIIVEDIMEHLK